MFLPKLILKRDGSMNIKKSESDLLKNIHGVRKGNESERNVLVEKEKEGMERERKRQMMKITLYTKRNDKEH